jgi:hypothetical protein
MSGFSIWMSKWHWHILLTWNLYACTTKKQQTLGNAASTGILLNYIQFCFIYLWINSHFWHCRSEQKMSSFVSFRPWKIWQFHCNCKMIPSPPMLLRLVKLLPGDQLLYRVSRSIQPVVSCSQYNPAVHVRQVFLCNVR